MGWGPAAAVAAAGPDHTAADGSLTAALAHACAHLWGGGAGVYTPTRLWECIVEKSID
eukprot:gene54316-22277_t